MEEALTARPIDRASREPLSTLVVGCSSYEEVSGTRRVSERSWRMLRIFADHLHEPIFAQTPLPPSGSGEHSLDLPPQVHLLPLSRNTRRSLLQRTFPHVNWERKLYGSYLDRAGAVYCRYPDWQALHFHRMAVARGMTVFASLHGDWAEVYAKMAEASPAPKRQYLELLARKADLALREVARTSRVLFCVGQALADKYGPASRNTVVFANYMHEEAEIHEREDTCHTPPFKLLYVGELHQRKGVEVLLDAIALLSRRGQPIECHLVGCGALRPALEERATNLGIQSITKFHGYTPFGAALLSIYRECDIFVLPALSGEGCPKVLVEAMSQGTPVIGTDVGSVKHVLSGGARGIVVRSGSAEELAAAASRLLTDRALRMALIRGGLDFARAQTYSVQRRRVGEALREFVPQVVRQDAETGP